MSTETTRADLAGLLARAEAMAGDQEVVTRALLRRVPLPARQGREAGTMGLITLDNGLDHRRPNTFGPRSLLALNEAIDAALADDDITSIGLTGKPFILAAGADLPLLAAGGPGGIRVIAELGHAVFRKLGDGEKPSFGFVNGLALGGGLEVALHCDYRTVLDSAAAVGLPEVMLGLIPGWGGAWLVPNLVGADRAVTLIVENPLSNGKTLRGRQAFELGLADACFGGADFLQQSLLWAADVLTGVREVRRPEVDRGEAWDAALARGRAVAQEKTGGASPAAYQALELIAGARTATREEGFAAEDAALAAMARTPELAASLYAFNLVQKRAKRPAGAPDGSLARPVTTVGIVGAGLMAGQLALLFVRRLQVPVVLTDLDQERVDRGVAYVHGEIDKLESRGRLSRDKANRYRALVRGVVDQAEAFGDADFVIEAVFEEMAVKQAVLSEVEKVVSPTCVLATNTSSLSVTEMARHLEHPERVVGFHFFNPVSVMPLVEVVRAERTDEATLATAFATGKTLGKTAILVRDSPSFIVNRLLGRFIGEIGRVIDEGTPVPVADAAFAGIAPMPPFVLLSLVGWRIALHNSQTLAAAFPGRFHVSRGLEAMVAHGKASYYGPDGSPDPDVAALFEPPADPLEPPADPVEPPADPVEPPANPLAPPAGGIAPPAGAVAPPAGAVELTAEQVREQVLVGLADEARRMLDEGVVAAVEDLDLAMIMGAGFSFWNGGLTMLLDRTGASERATGRRFHPRPPR